MKVEVLSYTNEPEIVCAAAMRSTRTKEPAEDIARKMTKIEADRLLIKARKMKHFGVFEHASFIVSVSGISRACTHQLVRHRLFSFLQTSSRILKPEGWVLPQSMTSRELGTEEYNNVVWAMQSIFNLYEHLVSLGVPKEDARFVLPQATKQHIVITGNARQWLHFFWMRCSPKSKAQWEIKEMAQEIRFQLMTIAPTIFEELVEC